MSDYPDNPIVDEAETHELRRQASDLARLAHHGARMTCIHPLGDRLLTSGWDGAYCIWDIASGELLHKRKLDFERVDVLAADPDRMLAVFGVQRALEVIDLDSGEPLPGFGREKMVKLAASPTHAADFHPDGDLLLTGAQDKRLRLWDLDSGSLIEEFRGHRRAISAIDVLVGGPMVVSAALDGELRTWDLREGAGKTARWLGQYPITALQTVDEHALFAVGNANGELVVWDAEHDEVQTRWPAHVGTIQDIAVIDHAHFATVAADGELRIWRLNSGELVAWYDAGVELHACAYHGGELLVGTDDGTLVHLQWPPETS